MESRTTDLIADLHARHEAWRRQGEDLARLHVNARAAAGREAAAILASARADISRTIDDARRALLVLTAQLHAIPGSAHARADHESDGPVPESVLQAQRDLERLLGDVRPELDEVAAQAQQFADPAPHPKVHQPEPPSAPILSVLEETSASTSVWRTWRFRIALFLVAATFTGAGTWWAWAARFEDLTPPIASIPPIPHATPAYDTIPTINASLVAAPPSSSDSTPAPRQD